MPSLTCKIREKRFWKNFFQEKRKKGLTKVRVGDIIVRHSARGSAERSLKIEQQTRERGCESSLKEISTIPFRSTQQESCTRVKC